MQLLWSGCRESSFQAHLKTRDQGVQHPVRLYHSYQFIITSAILQSSYCMSLVAPLSYSAPP